MAFLAGYIWGIAFIIFIGPVFFTLLKSSLENGFIAGLMVALGIFTSDLLCVVLLYGFGASHFFENAQHQSLMALAGSAILIGLGIKYALNPSIESKPAPRNNTLSILNHFIKGFLVNFVNPFVFVVWIGVIAFATTKYQLPPDRMYFLAGVLLMILTLDTLKALFAHRIKGFFKPDLLRWVYRAIGVGLIGFGIRMLVIGIMSAGIL